MSRLAVDKKLLEVKALINSYVIAYNSLERCANEIRLAKNKNKEKTHALQNEYRQQKIALNKIRLELIIIDRQYESLPDDLKKGVHNMTGSTVSGILADHHVKKEQFKALEDLRKDIRKQQEAYGDSEYARGYAEGYRNGLNEGRQEGQKELQEILQSLGYQAISSLNLKF